MIVTRAFLSIEYKTAEILAMQARKDFLMLSYLENKRNGSFWLNQSRRTREERADPNASQGRFNNSNNNNNNKIHNLKLGVHGSAEDHSAVNCSCRVLR